MQIHNKTTSLMIPLIPIKMTIMKRKTKANKVAKGTN